MRDTYSAPCRFYADDVARVNRINWYFVPNDTPIYEGATVFVPRIDDCDAPINSLTEPTAIRTRLRVYPQNQAVDTDGLHVHGDEQDFLGRSPRSKYQPGPNPPACPCPDVVIQNLFWIGFALYDRTPITPPPVVDRLGLLFGMYDTVPPPSDDITGCPGCVLVPRVWRVDWEGTGFPPPFDDGPLHLTFSGSPGVCQWISEPRGGKCLIIFSGGSGLASVWIVGFPSLAMYEQYIFPGTPPCMGPNTYLDSGPFLFIWPASITLTRDGPPIATVDAFGLLFGMPLWAPDFVGLSFGIGSEGYPEGPWTDACGVSFGLDDSSVEIFPIVDAFGLLLGTHADDVGTFRVGVSFGLDDSSVGVFPIVDAFGLRLGMRGMEGPAGARADAFGIRFADADIAGRPTRGTDPFGVLVGITGIPQGDEATIHAVGVSFGLDDSTAP